ncbi:MAG: Ribosomal subunit interface protein [Candidatus Magasanikbacteria bacterium]|nr:Ribosomal subunit interface protein [Candidatus Magasanikbacteria bacterium]
MPNMQFQIKATGIELTPTISAYVEDKLGKLAKLITSMDPDTVLVHVEVGKTTDHHKKGKIFRAEVRMRLPGCTIYTEESAEELYAAIDLIANEARRQIVTQKEKNKTRVKPRI